RPGLITRSRRCVHTPTDTTHHHSRHNNYTPTHQHVLRTPTTRGQPCPPILRNPTTRPTTETPTTVRPDGSDLPDPRTTKKTTGPQAPAHPRNGPHHPHRTTRPPPPIPRPHHPRSPEPPAPSCAWEAPCTPRCWPGS